MGAITKCLAAARTFDLSKCEPAGLSLADWATVTVPIVGLIIWFGRKIAKQLAQRRPIGSFAQLRMHLKPLVQDNSRIFREFGPKSGADAEGQARFDLSVWYQIRSKIAENNDKIANLVRENASLIPQEHKDVFERWLAHIYAFHAHLADPSVDYRQHQFPQEIEQIVR